MTLVVGLALGLVAGLALVRLLGPTLAAPVFERRNYRNRELPTAGGIVVVVAAVAGMAVASLVDPEPAQRLAVLAAVGFGFLGLLDDLAGSGGDGRGFAGHLRALGTGRLTTGAVKLLGGGALAVVLVAQDSWGRTLVDAAVVALAANLANLFDRAPGRTTKVAVVAFAGLVVAAGFTSDLGGVALVVGAAVATLPADLGERLMLGDTGANAVGAALGIGVVLTVGPDARVVVAVVLLVLNLASELVSFSRVIDAVPPIRWVDRLGRYGGSP